MESVASDPELASEMLALMNKELKKTRARIEQLEGSGSKASAKDITMLVELQGRAEGAETAMKILQENFEAVASENNLLRVALEELQERKIKIKQEDHNINSDVNTSSKHMKSKGVSTDTPEDSNTQTLEHVRNLEETLEKYYTKYKSGKELRKELADEQDRLQKQVATLECEARELRGKLALIKQESSNDILPPPETSNSLLEYMENLPTISKRPGRPAPILGEDIDLREYLASDPRTNGYCAHILYLPGLLTWAKGRMHALVCGPMTFMNEKGNWVKGSKFKSLYGKTFHLFHHHREHIFYDGFYQAIDFRSRNSEGFDKFHNISSQALAESTVIGSDSSSYRGKLAILSQLYEAKALKVEYLGLQCIGFDSQLYNRLWDRYEVSQLAPPVAKRKLELLYPEIGGDIIKHAVSSSPPFSKKKLS